MPCVKSTAAGFAVGRGERDGAGAMKEGTSMARKTPLEKTEKGWDSFLPFYSQWYWTKDWLDRKTKAWYHGPRIKWMNLVKEKKK